MRSLRHATVLVGTMTLTAALAACSQPTTSTPGSATSSIGSVVETQAPGQTGAVAAARTAPCTSKAVSATATAGPATTAPDAASGTSLAKTTATGPVDNKTAPKVSLGPLPIKVDEVTRMVLEPGEGPAATRDSIVTTRLVLFNGTSGKELDNGFADGRQPESFQLNRADLLPGLTQGLIGAKKGMRVAWAIPPKDAFGENGQQELGIAATDTIVVVGDIVEVKPMASAIEGSMKQGAADLPQVSFPNGASEAPEVTVPVGSGPTETTQTVLIEGSGPEVKAGQKISAQYHGVLWGDCSTFDSSWERGAPAEFSIGTGGVIKGWDSTLVGKKVGSRVLLTIPPKDGYGGSEQAPENLRTNVLIFVVDILDAHA